MSLELQPRLHNDRVRLEPLESSDLESLYAVASDPLIWEQHPSKERYKRDVFDNYFKGAMESKGALRVIDNINGGTVWLFALLRLRSGGAAGKHRVHIHRTHSLGAGLQPGAEDADARSCFPGR